MSIKCVNLTVEIFFNYTTIQKYAFVISFFMKTTLTNFRVQF